MVKHEHSHHDGHSQPHTHGVIDPSILTHERGLWAVKWSFVGLMITALMQVVVVIVSDSVALLADTIHNFADAATAVPLGIAFCFARLKPTKRFTYGYGLVEDLAGIAVVLIILFSAVFAGYEAIQRFIHPKPVMHLWAVAIASIVGFLGNEAVAVFRIRVGKQIGSVALIADGYHARTDGWTSLAVLFGAIGVWLGFPLADPLIGLLISLTIFYIVWDSAKAVLFRMLDGIEPEILEEIQHAIDNVPGVKKIGEIRARWIGHKVHAEINVAVESKASLSEAHEVAKEVGHQVSHHVPQLGHAVVHVDPEEKSGEAHHQNAHDTCRD